MRSVPGLIVGEFRGKGLDGREAFGKGAGLGDGNGVVEPDDCGRLVLEQRAIERGDLWPVRRRALAMAGAAIAALIW